MNYAEFKVVMGCDTKSGRKKVMETITASGIDEAAQKAVYFYPSRDVLSVVGVADHSKAVLALNKAEKSMTFTEAE